MHLFLRRPDGSFAPRREVPFARLDRTPRQYKGLERGHPRPHLLDFDRDGRADLVLDDAMSWTLKVGTDVRGAAPAVGVRPFALPEVPGRNLYDVEFTDWDGDGAFDALFAGAYLETAQGPWRYDLYWCRNTAPRGEPKFAPPARLLAAPAQSGAWQYEGYAVVPRGRPGYQDLVVSVSKDWDRGPGGRTNTSQLVLFRRK